MISSALRIATFSLAARLAAAAVLIAGAGCSAGPAEPPAEARVVDRARVVAALAALGHRGPYFEHHQSPDGSRVVVEPGGADTVVFGRELEAPLVVGAMVPSEGRFVTNEGRRVPLRPAASFPGLHGGLFCDPQSGLVLLLYDGRFEVRSLADQDGSLLDASPPRGFDASYVLGGGGRIFVFDVRGMAAPGRAWTRPGHNVLVYRSRGAGSARSYELETSFRYTEVAAFIDPSGRYIVSRASSAGGTVFDWRAGRVVLEFPRDRIVYFAADDWLERRLDSAGERH